VLIVQGWDKEASHTKRASGMLDDLLKKGVIKSPDPKYLEEAGRTADPKYYRYHRIVSHPLKKCIILNECIMWLAKEWRIILDLDETTEVGHFTVQEADELDSEMDHAKVLDDETNEELNIPPEESGDGNIQPRQQWKEKNEITV